MSCEIPAIVENYLLQVENGTPRACGDQLALAKHIRRAFKTENLIVDTEQLQKYLSLVRYFPYQRLFPWEEFLTALWLCTYDEEGLPRWKTLFCMVGRGTGKDGFIAFSSFCLVSPYNPIGHYDVDICANNEEQAVTPVSDIIEALESTKWEKKLKKFYYHTKEVVQGIGNKGKVRGRTNNPKGRDGMRSGAVIFNEVHAYENYDNIKVFVTGQGKVAQPRVGIFSSNGEVNDGPLDDYLARAKRILYENEPDNGFLPFICRLDSKTQIDDPDNWYMANPSLFYMPHLRQEIADEYRDWKDHPEQNGDFVTKRMGIRQGFQEIAVTDYEKILTTKSEPPDMTGWSCTVGIDYAEMSDWAAVDLHFRSGDKRMDINHAWICRDSKTLSRVKAPWRDWVAAGHCTFVDDVSISPDAIAEYIAEAGRKYNIVKLAMDNFRWALLADSLRKIGFDAEDKERVRLIRPSDIMKTDPIIQSCFDRGLFYWGDNPCLRWAVNNTKRVRASKSQGSDTGNFYYAKIEAKSRKTDPFMALVAAMAVEDVLGGNCAALDMPEMGAFAL